MARVAAAAQILNVISSLQYRLPLEREPPLPWEIRASMSVPKDRALENRGQMERGSSVGVRAFQFLYLAEKWQPKAGAVRCRGQADTNVGLRSLHRIVATHQTRKIRQKHMGRAIDLRYRGGNRRRRGDLNAMGRCQAVKERLLHLRIGVLEVRLERGVVSFPRTLWKSDHVWLVVERHGAVAGDD